MEKLEGKEKFYNAHYVDDGHGSYATASTVDNSKRDMHSALSSNEQKAMTGGGVDEGTNIPRAAVRDYVDVFNDSCDGVTNPITDVHSSRTQLELYGVEEIKLFKKIWGYSRFSIWWGNAATVPKIPASL